MVTSKCEGGALPVFDTAKMLSMIEDGRQSDIDLLFCFVLREYI